jgi:YesN/AraC family two-component response regulator
MEKRSAGKAGAEQMLLIRLEELLINLIRESGYISKHTELCPMARELAETSLVESVMLYLEEHISENITMDQLCVKFNIGKTILKTAFKEVTGHGVISYHARQKIEKAKRLIRENTYNYTQIADILGYSSIHYFSSAFKKATNMTPSEYAISVKAKMGG